MGSGTITIRILFNRICLYNVCIIAFVCICKIALRETTFLSSISLFLSSCCCFFSVVRLRSIETRPRKLSRVYIFTIQIHRVPLCVWINDISEHRACLLYIYIQTLYVKQFRRCIRYVYDYLIFSVGRLWIYYSLTPHQSRDIKARFVQTNETIMHM